VVEHQDRETRDRLLAAATRLFAERGFGKVTVRDICERAKANVAAVNYHFGGKVGLYEQVLRSAIGVMQATTALARDAGAGRPADARLRSYVQVFIHRIVGAGHNSWIHQLMMHEMSDPTPGLDLVIDQVLRPRMEYLGGIVAELLHCRPDDPHVRRCAMSVHAQCMALLNSHIGQRIDPTFQVTPQRLDEIAEHITRFSLAGIQAARTSQGQTPGKPQKHRTTEPQRT
jgi:TetR/AcrR family transcriptional regulator, regulator of cefoperazone and chloramphenicol sensitivity